MHSSKEKPSASIPIGLGPSSMLHPRKWIFKMPNYTNDECARTVLLSTCLQSSVAVVHKKTAMLCMYVCGRGTEFRRGMSTPTNVLLGTHVHGDRTDTTFW